MITYKVDIDHKIEVTSKKDGSFDCQLFERIAGEWHRLGAKEHWYSLDDLKWAYCIN